MSVSPVQRCVMGTAMVAMQIWLIYVPKPSEQGETMTKKGTKQMKYWKPLIPLRYVMRGEMPILQQAWGLYVPTPDAPYESQIDYMWRDIPTLPENKGSGLDWIIEEPLRNAREQE